MKSHRKSRRTVVIIIAIALILIGVGASFYAIKHRDAQVSVRGVNDVDYGKPTEKEQKAGDDQKAENVKQSEIENRATPPSDTLKPANLVVVDSSQYGTNFEVRGYVSNIFENGGSCTATFKKSGSNDVTVSGAASASATTTQCNTIEIPISSFPSDGSWQFTLAYSSATAAGTTNSTGVTITK